jgi:O-antigen/teichoic acid export membrane protein
MLFVLAKQIVVVISSAEFLATTDSAGSDTVLQILAFLVPITFCSMFFGYILIASGKQATLIIINLLTVATNVALDFFTIPAFGIVGAAYSSLFSEFVMIALMIHFTRKAITFTPQLRVIISVVFTSIIGGLAAYSVLQATTLNSVLDGILAGIIFTITYFLGLKLFKVITPEIIEVLKVK